MGVEDDTSVKVTVRIRPQLARERIDMCQVCTSVTPDEPQVVMGNDKCFTFDHVMDIDAAQDKLYETCSKVLIEGTFEGYNATIFAYGQTGSGKTYTMGSGFDSGLADTEVGIIPRAVQHLFSGIEARKREALEKGAPQPDFKVNAQFLELYNEEINDLLDTTRDPSDRAKKSHIKIHEDAGGGIYCVGLTTKPVQSVEDTMQCLQIGTLSRSTASTNMNAMSSRSHAIFTLHIRQTRIVAREPDDEGEKENDVDTTEVGCDLETETLTAKFHFVDLAGSERLKRTGATGDRAREGISINCGLLALGNVISALGDRAKKGSHVPYRDSKLTRLLQDSLGGNSRTVMIACISPSDRDFMETLNTLKYANRARNIRNKVSVNQDKTSRQIAALRAEIQSLQQELNEYKSGKRLVGEDGVETINDMFQENNMLQTENDNLRQRIKTLQETIDKLRARNVELLSERDSLRATSGGQEGEEAGVQQLIQGYIQEIEDLRTKLMEAESLNEVIRRSATTRATSRLHSAASPLLHVPLPGGSPNVSVDMSGSSPNSDLLALARQQVELERQRLKKVVKETKEGGDSEKGTEEIEQDTTAEENHIAENGEAGEEEGASEEEEEDEEESDSVDEGLSDFYDDNFSDDDSSAAGALMLVTSKIKRLTEGSEEKRTDDDNKEECENLHEDLANLQCEMSIKEKLIEELELSQRRLHAMKAQYEEKLVALKQQIKGTESERDRIIGSLGEREHQSAEQVQKVRSEYERKLASMQSELAKVQAAKREHAKLLKNQTHYEKQLKTLQRDLGELKKIKVKLMNDMKEEAQKKRALEARHTKDTVRHKKQQRLMEGKLQKLEADKRQKDLVLKRKMEELESLKSRSRSQISARSTATTSVSSSSTPAPVPSSSGGAPPGTSTGGNERPPAKPVPTYARRTRFSPRAAKNKWAAIEKSMSSLITKKQTITHMERDMDRWLRERESKSKKIERCVRRKQAAEQDPGAEDGPARERESKSKKIERCVRRKQRVEQDPGAVGGAARAQELEQQIEQLRADVAFIQDNISDCQANIIQMEETKEDFEEEPGALIDKCQNLEEAKYLLEHFLQLVISKGLHAMRVEDENKELAAKLHQENVNSTLQRDMLQFLIVNQTGIEIDGVDDSLIRDNDDYSETESSDDEEEDSVLSGALALLNLPQDKVLEGGGSGVTPGLVELARLQSSTDSLRDSSTNIHGRRDKARRKTTRPEDLLYAGSGGAPAADLTTSLPTPTHTGLLPVPENAEMVDHNKSKMGANMAAPSQQSAPSVSTVTSPGASIGAARAGRARHPLDLSSQTKASKTPSPAFSRRKPSSLPKPEPVLNNGGLRPTPSGGTASPTLRRKAQSAGSGSTGLSVSRQGSTPDGSEATPPGSPATMRKSRSGGDNVFSRLSSQPGPGPNPTSENGPVSAGDGATDPSQLPSIMELDSNQNNVALSKGGGVSRIRSPTTPTAPTTKGTASSERRRAAAAARRNLTETAKALTISAPAAPERKNFTRTGSMRDRRTKTSAAPLPATSAASGSGSRTTPTTPTASRRSSTSSNASGTVHRSQTPGQTSTSTRSTNGSGASTPRSTSIPPKSPGPNRKAGAASKTANATTPKLIRKSSAKNDSTSGGDGSATSAPSTPRTPTTPRAQRRSLANAESTAAQKRQSVETASTVTSRNRTASAASSSGATTPTPRNRTTSGMDQRSVSGSSASNSMRSVSSVDTEATDPSAGGGVDSDGLLAQRRGRSVMSRGVIQPVSSRAHNKNAPLVHAFTAAGHSRAVLHIHATESFMFSASKDKTAKVWDLAQGQEVLTFSDHPNNVNHIKFCEYSGLAFTTCAYFMKVWDPRQGNKCIRTITSAGQMSSGPISIDSISRQISCPPGEAVISDLAINSTGSVLYSAAGNTVKIWDLRTFKVMGKLSGGHQSQIMVLAMDDTDTADGNICIVTGSKDHYIKVFELMEDSVGLIMPRCTLDPPHYDGIQSLCLMGDLLFSGSRDSCIKKWDLAEEQLQHTITSAHKDWVKGLAFMPGGNCLISGCRSGVVKLWHIDNCTQLGEIQAHRSQINAITTNSALIFTASDDRAIHFWTSSANLESDLSDLE